MRELLHSHTLDLSPPLHCLQQRLLLPELAKNVKARLLSAYFCSPRRETQPHEMTVVSASVFPQPPPHCSFLNTCQIFMTSGAIRGHSSPGNNVTVDVWTYEVGTTPSTGFLRVLQLRCVTCSKNMEHFDVICWRIECETTKCLLGFRLDGSNWGTTWVNACRTCCGDHHKLTQMVCTGTNMTAVQIFEIISDEFNYYNMCLVIILIL